MKACLIELLKKLNNDNNAAAPAASVNVLTIRIKEVEEETPAATGVKVESVKLF